MNNTTFPMKMTVLALGALTLSACDRFNAFDLDLRGSTGQLDTSDAARNATAAAPKPDARGVVSYPGYQIALARRGDTVQSLAVRVGLPATEIARFNALPESVVLRQGEVVALPRRVPEPQPGLGEFDVSTIAGTAIDRAEGRPGLPSGIEPRRYRVAPGETAFSIARIFDVPVASLAEWNGLGPDLALRVGQYLLIPTRSTRTVQTTSIEEPGNGSVTPLPPSATAPLPANDVKPAAVVPTPKPQPIAAPQTASSDTSRLRMPVKGSIVRPFQKGTNEGIAISTSAGAPVVAADSGTVAAITRDTDQVPILVIRHEGNLLTVYAGVDEIAVKKGDKVSRGQKIAVVRAATPPFLHFEVREGFDSVDPDPYLK